MSYSLIKFTYICCICLMLMSCSDSSEQVEEGTETDVTVPPVLIDDTVNKLVSFDYKQTSNDKAYKAAKVQSNTFSNSSGTFRLPIDNQQLSANITASIDVEDLDGINAVYIGFPNFPQAYLLCESQCGTQFHKTVTGINPLEFEQNSGDLRLELWIDDSQNNRVLVDSVNFLWRSVVITGFNAERSERNIDFSWQGIGGYLRYNVYVASSAGVNHKNYQSLNDGQAFLALKNPELAFTDQNDSKVFFSVVTGVDGSGESAFSDQIKVSALSGAADFPPNAENDAFSVNEDTTLIANLLVNDTDQEDGKVIINQAPVTSPKNGELIINQDGSFSYEPAADFSGRDIFTYEVSDELGQTDTALVVISVLATNDEPESSYNNFNLDGVLARPSSVTFKGRSKVLLDVPAPGLLINDLDIDSENLTLSTEPIIAPTQGSLVLKSDGGFIYTANEGAQGTDSFTYQVTDGQGGSAQSNVVITLNGDSFPPVAANDMYEIQQDQTLIVDNSSLQSILSNDTDNDQNDSLTISNSLVRGPVHGDLNLSANGTFNYFPNAGYYGVDSFIYEVTDLQGNTAQAGVLITVIRKNTAPTTQTDNYVTDEDTTLSINTNEGVL